MGRFCWDLSKKLIFINIINIIHFIIWLSIFLLLVAVAITVLFDKDDEHEN